MKKLLFVLLMVLSGQVMAAQEIVIPYANLPPGGPYAYLKFHNTGCVPSISSLESGNAFVAVWLASVGENHITVSVYNALTTSAMAPLASGGIKIRLGNC